MKLAFAIVLVVLACAPIRAQTGSPTPTPSIRSMNSSERIQALIGQLIIQDEQQRDQIDSLTRELSEARTEIARLKENAGSPKSGAPK